MTRATGKPPQGKNGAQPGILGRRKIAVMSNTSTTLRQQLQQLEAEMRAASLWSEQPPSQEAMASTMPFMYDTLQIEQWLQWVFMPRLHALLDANAVLPGNCSVQPLAEHEWNNRMPQGLHGKALQLLQDIDRTLSQG
jgi:uncharacterized protein YqcC (DUF446 family)